MSDSAPCRHRLMQRASMMQKKDPKDKDRNHECLWLPKLGGNLIVNNMKCVVSRSLCGMASCRQCMTNIIRKKLCGLVHDVLVTALVPSLVLWRVHKQVSRPHGSSKHQRVGNNSTPWVLLMVCTNISIKVGVLDYKYTWRCPQFIQWIEQKHKSKRCTNPYGS